METSNKEKTDCILMMQREIDKLRRRLANHNENIEELLQQIPYCVGISKLTESAKADSRVSDYWLSLRRYAGGGVWCGIKDFYGDCLSDLAHEALEWCKNVHKS